MPSFVRWLIAGLVGGAVGAAIWAAITYFTNHEIGYVAWGVGILVGFCVRFAAGDEDGFGPGITAAMIAIVALVGGKYAATTLLVEKHFGDAGQVVAVTPDDIQLDMMAEIAADWEDQKKPLKWPAGKNFDSAEAKGDYPPEVVKEAEKRWAALKPEEQQAQIQAQTVAMQEITAALKGAVQREGFKASFGPIDILFFLLAIASAWKIGSGVTTDD